MTTERSIGHDEGMAELGALALGALSADEERAVLTHVSGCAQCTEELARLREIVAAMPAQPSVGKFSRDASRAVRGRLLARADAAPRVIPARGRSTQWLAVAATIAFAVAALGYLNVSRERDQLRVASARRDSAIRRLSAEMRERLAELSTITGPGVHVMELGSTGVRAPSARMFWNPGTNRWALYAQGLAAPKAGRAYELWLVTKDAKIPAGMFTPRSDGTAVFQASYAMQPSDLKAIAVTEEPTAGVKSPTGPMVLVGAVAP